MLFDAENDRELFAAFRALILVGRHTSLPPLAIPYLGGIIASLKALAGLIFTTVLAGILMQSSCLSKY